MNVNHCGFIHKLCQSLYFAHFSLIKDVCICTILDQNLSTCNMMNGKIKVLHFASFASFTSCHHDCFFPSCCLPWLVLSPIMYPALSCQTSFLSLFMHSSRFHIHASCPLTYPHFIIPIFQSFNPLTSLSTLMRTRMTMNNPIIIRAQQAFPPLPHTLFQTCHP